MVREWSGRDHLPFGAESPQRIGETKWDGRPLVLYRHSTLLPTPETSHDFDEMCLLAGESAALVSYVRPAGEIVREMTATAERIIAGRRSRLIGHGAIAVGERHLQDTSSVV